MLARLGAPAGAPAGRLNPERAPKTLRRSLPWRLPVHDRLARQLWHAHHARSFQAEGVAGAAAAAAAQAAPAPLPVAASHDGAQTTHFTSLDIKNFALVEEQRVQLAPGLTVITGESGSGKSVLVEALGQILGGSAYDEAVRPPATSAVLEARVAVAPADQPLLRQLLWALGVPQKAARSLETLTLRRELAKGPDGIRSRCYINGSPTSVRALREVGQLLVDVNGQHAALSLKDAATRLRLLDRLAGTAPAAERFAAALADWQAAQAQLRELDALSDEQQREAFQRLVDEVQAAGVEPGEDRALRQQLRQLDGRRAAAESCRLVSVGLGGGGDGGGIAQALRDVQLQVKQLLSQEERLAAAAAAEAAEEKGAAGRVAGLGSEDDDSGVASAAEADGDDGGDGASAAGMLQAAVSLLDEAQGLLDEAEERVVGYARLYRFSQAEYDGLSARLQQLERLMKQHDAASADELLELAERQGTALDLYFQMEGRRDELEAAAAALLRVVQVQAAQLSERRRAAAARMRQAAQAVLGDLAMGGSVFDVRMTWAPLSAAAAAGAGGGGSLAVAAEEAAACGQQAGQYRVRPSGLDVVEFLFATGPGEPLRPLSTVASGGETARLMLALKAAPAFMPGGNGSGDSGDHEAAAAEGEAGALGAGAGGQIMVLDEIDSGIGSRLGQPIGAILRRMAATGGGGGISAQILCVSHLPQVAAAAEHHLCVRKAAGPDKGRMITQFELLHGREARLAEISAMAGLPPAAVEELLAAAGEG